MSLEHKAQYMHVKIGAQLVAIVVHDGQYMHVKIVIITPWSFNTRGLYLCGPFPLTHGQRQFIIVDVDYFTKMIEVEPIVAISTKRVKKIYGKLWYLAMVCLTLL